jgi:7-carboxy-7-deazaguanine synthase
MTLRLSELYTSVQGEGPRVGTPTQFVRFGGCNLRCPGWPCDTQHAIDPKYRKEWEKLKVVDLIERILDAFKDTGATNICFTGGEPFLQPNSDLEKLTHELVHRYQFNVECFSNGTLQYPDWAATQIQFVMDWKLPGSEEQNVNLVTRWRNLRLLNASAAEHAVKFVLKDEADLERAIDVASSMREQQLYNLQVYYGRVWQSKWTDADMIEAVLARKLSWKLNMQVHNYIWDPHERKR